MMTSGIDAVAIGISAVADHGAVVALMVLIETLRGRRSVRVAAEQLTLVGSAVIVVNTILKRLVGRSRPTPAATSGARRTASTMVRRTPSSPSFPSGHTLATTVAAVALPATTAGQIAALAGAGAVGWSRLRVGAHHGGDVAGGLLLGALLGLSLRRVTQRHGLGRPDRVLV